MWLYKTGFLGFYHAMVITRHAARRSLVPLRRGHRAWPSQITALLSPVVIYFTAVKSHAVKFWTDCSFLNKVIIYYSHKAIAIIHMATIKGDTALPHIADVAGRNWICRRLQHAGISSMN